MEFLRIALQARAHKCISTRVSALQACDDQLCGQIANAEIGKVCLRVRGYRNITIPELGKFTSVDFWTVRWIRTTLHQQIIRTASRKAFTPSGSRWSRVSSWSDVGVRWSSRLGDGEAEAKEKARALAEHVARHPEDVGRTVEDFNWVLWTIVRPAA